MSKFSNQALPLLGALLLALPAEAAPRVVEGTPLADPAPTGQAELRARIFFTANLMGEFEPCSCPDTPLGGIAQSAAIVDGSQALPAHRLSAAPALERVKVSHGIFVLSPDKVSPPPQAAGGAATVATSPEVRGPRASVPGCDSSSSMGLMGVKSQTQPTPTTRTPKHMVPGM